MLNPSRLIRRGLVFLLLKLPALAAATLTLATYNVENYVVTDRMVDGVYRKDYPKSEDAKHALRAVIRALDADVLLLQEMGPQPYLDELQRDLRAEGTDYPYTALVDAPDPDRHLAVLSRVKPHSVHPYAHLPFRYLGKPDEVRRGLLELSFSTPAGEITIFGVHLKSRLTERPDDPMSATQRAGEAEAVRTLILKRFPDPGRARFFIVGDCNDVPGSKPLRLLLRRGDATITEMLPAADSRGDTWTHAYWKQETYTRVDYVLASPAAKPLVRGGAARIYDGPETRKASDHRPVIVQLELGGQ